MNKQWLELEGWLLAYREEVIKEAFHPIANMIVYQIQNQMEKIKSEYYYQSLKEAGYF